MARLAPVLAPCAAAAGDERAAPFSRQPPLDCRARQGARRAGGGGGRDAPARADRRQCPRRGGAAAGAASRRGPGARGAPKHGSPPPTLQLRIVAGGGRRPGAQGCCSSSSRSRRCSLGLAMMSRRPPLLATRRRRGRQRRFRQGPRAARFDLAGDPPANRSAVGRSLPRASGWSGLRSPRARSCVRSREQLAARREQFAALERQALKPRRRRRRTGAGQRRRRARRRARTSSKLRSAEAGNRSAWAMASELAASDPAPPRPVRRRARQFPGSIRLPACRRPPRSPTGLARSTPAASARAV